MARPILREPQYSETPLYVLLALGDEAEYQSWLVVDGPIAYIDRNGDGDLTGLDEKIKLDEKATAEINVAKGEYKAFNVFKLGSVNGHELLLHVWVLNEDFVADPNENEYVSLLRRLRIDNRWANASLYRMPSGAQIPVILCPRPKDVQISHVDGPLTFRLKRSTGKKLERKKENVFDVHIGTPGVAATNCPWPAFSPLTTAEVPEDLHPIAVIEFPNQKQNGQPLKLEVNLDRRC
jgi:hypothetical protein